MNMADQNHETSPESTIKLLVASDCHIGYMEKDPIRHNDSLQTFEEILKIANEQNVDMILLGGDLFHDNKPSRKILHNTISLFRRYCLGDKPCQLEFLSDQSVNFSHCKFPVVNYEDPNINISYPVFSVHGNHDDPTGEGSLSAIDLLSCAGFLNHFGKASNVDDIEISPLLLQKGETKLALYGLGSVRDERLNRTFSKGKVKMLRPREDEDDWFNIFVVHQNRSKHGATNHLPQSYLDDFLDLIIWGHEHECLIDPQWSEEGKPFYVSQPGSSISTSLCEGESKEKHVGILQIFQKAFKMTKIPLQTVRPFRMEEVVLSETGLKPNEEDKVLLFLKQKVEKMIKEELRLQKENRARPLPPLIRVKVEYSGGYETINPHRFGQLFVDQVANCKDILLFHRKRKQVQKGENIEDEGGIPFEEIDRMKAVKMEDLIYEYLKSADQKMQLSVLSERRMIKALREFVNKDERDAISELVKWQLAQSQNELFQRSTTEGTLDEEIARVKRVWQDQADEEAEDQEIERVLSGSRAATSANEINDLIDADDIEDDAVEVESTSSRRGRRGGRGRGSKSRGAGNKEDAPLRGGGKRGRGRAATNNTLMDSFLTASSKKKPQPTSIPESDDEDVMPSRIGHSSSRSRISIELSDDSEDDYNPFALTPPSKRGRRH